MATIGSMTETSDDDSFHSEDLSDDETITIISENQHPEESFSSHDSLQLGQQDNNNDIHCVSNAKIKNNEPEYLSLTVTTSSAASSAKSSFSPVDKNSEGASNQSGEQEDDSDGDNNHLPSERFFIVKSTYPKYSKWDSTDPDLAECERRAKTIHQILPPLTGFDSSYQAEYEGRKARNECIEFCGGFTPLDDDGEYSECEDDYYHFHSYDDPPWDSEALEKSDRDMEVIIDIMTMKQFEQKLSEKGSDVEYIEEMDKEYKYEETFQLYENKLLVRESGCSAFYSYPIAQPWDIQAEMEVRESLRYHKDAERKMRPDIEHVKSFMFQGRQYGVFGQVLENSHYSDCDDEEVTCPDIEVKTCGLLRHLRACKGLEELFIQLNTDIPSNLLQLQNALHYANQVSHTFIRKLEYVAPHCCQLRVLSFGPSITLHPKALEAISMSMPFLERLDISFALSMQFAPHGSDEVSKYYPYEAPLLAVVHELDRLVRLDLGFEMVDFSYTDTEGRSRTIKKNRILCLVSEVALQEIRESVIELGGTITEAYNTTLPPRGEDNCDSKMRVLQEMMLDHKLDNAIKEVALEKYREMGEFFQETCDAPDHHFNLSKFDLLLEASISCSVIEKQGCTEDIAIEGAPEPTSAKRTLALDDVEQQQNNSKKRTSNVTIDDTVNSKRYCV